MDMVFNKQERDDGDDGNRLNLVNDIQMLMRLRHDDDERPMDCDDPDRCWLRDGESNDLAFLL